jgi:outer membrane autotransporter protein
MAWLGYDLSDHIGLPPDQRLAVGGFYRHDWISSTQSGIAETSGDNNAFGFIVAYQFHAWHAAAAFEIDWGDAKVTGVNNAVSGSFDTGGYAFGVQIGRVFTLSGDPRPTARTDAPWAFQLKQASVYLDPVFRVGYGRSVSDGFTPTGAAAIGKEIERAWTIGGGVTLSAIIPQTSGPLWRPYISFGLERQLGYRHTIDLPATGQVANLDHDKTYWTVNGGVGVWLNRNVSLGVSGFYRGSGSQDTGGGLFWFRVNLLGPGGYLRGGGR